MGYLGLDVCVSHDGQWRWFGGSMPYYSRSKHPGQIVLVHLAKWTLHDSIEEVEKYNE